MKYSTELAKAAKKVQEAVAILDALQTKARDNRDWPMVGSVQDTKTRFMEVLESDHGEAGLVPFIATLKKQGQ